MHGTYRCNLPEPETPAVPAADVATPPQAGTPVITEPVEIIITTSDLLELIPSTPQILMDRGPFGLKNAHTNFYASDNQAQTITRSMFGQDVTIVATPVEYRWDYGDGNTLVTQTPGHPVEIFNTETETSHQYTEPGLYTVTLTTVFEGTYQVDGGPTQSVTAPVTQQADPVEIRIWRAVTRNVDQTCTQDPSAWGCELTADPR
ncbi:MAG TPA: PKD domain-containing protein [Enteractinococcus sp.]